MTVWFLALGAVLVGGAVLALLARRAVRSIDPTCSAVDDWRRDLRLAVIELRVEEERIARRIAHLDRRNGYDGRR